MNAELENVLNKLKALLGTGVDATVADATDLEARAQEAKLGTKASDIEAGIKAMAAVEALEAKLTEANAIIAKQAGQISALEAAQSEMSTAQKAHQFRAEKAIKEVAELLTTLNAKPELTAPPEQDKLAAIESSTKAKIDATEGGKASDALTLKRFEYGTDGRHVVKPI